MHRSRSQIMEELAACIRCNECLVACPALPAPIPIETLNRETQASHISQDVARFARACYQCGACVPVCPVGLHRDAMMLWLKVRLLRKEDDRGGAARIAVGDDASTAATENADPAYYYDLTINDLTTNRRALTQENDRGSDTFGKDIATWQ